MKRLIGCPAGAWAKKLFTLDRFEKIDYFVDFAEGQFGIYGNHKKVYNFEHLKNENKDDIIIIITDTKQYDTIKQILIRYDFKENIHFFNGWKLNHNFYQLYFGEKEWKEFEYGNANVLSAQREGWKKRAKAMSALIPKDVKSILDIGCGECILKEFLPKDITYYGLDYCRRDEDTIVCDINKEQIPGDIDADLYYMAGVTDYIHDMGAFVKQFQCKYVLLSKARNERFIRLDDKVLDGYMGYGNKPYYVSNLITDMADMGFFCITMQWQYEERDEYYLLFKKIGVL